MAKPRKKSVPPARQVKNLDTLTPVDVIVGRHPTLGNLHRLSRYDNGQIKIERQPYVSLNPATGKEELTAYDDLIHQITHQKWLWEAISKNPSDEWPT